MTYVLIFSAALGAILLSLLAAASSNTVLFEEHYPLIVGLNVALALGLAGLVTYQLAALARQRRQKVFGSLLTFRVLVMFALVTVLPGALVYTVSVQFLSKSIESWFDVRVDRALEGGIKLGRAALDAMLVDMQVKAGLMSADLAEMPPAQQLHLIHRMREQVGADDVVLVTASGRLVGSASRDLDKKATPPTPSILLLRQARDNRQYAAIESSDKALLMRVIVPIANSGLGDTQRFLQLTHPVPQQVVEAGESVQTAYRAYKELSLARGGLKEIYILTLTLTLLLALLGAVALSLLLSRRLSQPLAVLAQATQAVARGDFSQRVPVISRDELGILTQSFNSMTGQLDDARRGAETHRAQIERANAFLESILANLSAGVLVFDRSFALRIANRGAGRILHVEMDGLVGKPLEEWPQLAAELADLARIVREEFERNDEAHWQREVELAPRGAVLLLRGSALPVGGGGGYVVVFDDITQLIVAQRATAWGEVARRLAHEIKNPLTPIQLAAERLEAKLAPRLAVDDARALSHATETIVAQVAALKNMVDEFREYARLPSPKLEPIDLNRLVRDVLSLYEQSGWVEARLEPGLPPVCGDRNQLRQVIHNLLQNAQDALTGRSNPRIEVATSRHGRGALLRIVDNGVGFPEAIMKRAFEPYVTTKPKGTGLGLAIVKKIIDEHHGSIAIENRRGEDTAGSAPGGAAVSISLPFEKAA
jgi:nitrogen fixation/metabolism regulation signal transduction histidine kinase